MTKIRPEFLNGEIDSRGYINLRPTKPKMTEQEHLECEIQEYQIELQRHEESIERLKVRIEQKEEKLKEFKMKKTSKKTLLEIITEWNDNEENPPCEDLLNRIVEWLPNEYNGYGASSDYNIGWNQCLLSIKNNLKPPQESDSKNLPYFVGN